MDDRNIPEHWPDERKDELRTYPHANINIDDPSALGAPDEIRYRWGADELRRMADEMGLDLSDCSLSNHVAPTGLSRACMMEGLRMLAAIPADDGQPSARRNRRNVA